MGLHLSAREMAVNLDAGVAAVQEGRMDIWSRMRPEVRVQRLQEISRWAATDLKAAGMGPPHAADALSHHAREAATHLLERYRGR